MALETELALLRRLVEGSVIDGLFPVVRRSRGHASDAEEDSGHGIAPGRVQPLLRPVAVVTILAFRVAVRGAERRRVVRVLVFSGDGNCGMRVQFLKLPYDVLGGGCGERFAVATRSEAGVFLRESQEVGNALASVRLVATPACPFAHRRGRAARRGVA